ncbi:MAG: electron transport complex subunit RsxC [Candidatus Omnitrophota bacterium]|jgi:electron transport complex protein RnfC
MVKLEEQKSRTEDKKIEKIPLPKTAYIPLSQHLGKPCLPEVKIGDMVLTGQKIAGVQAQVYAPIHASISGKVISIQDWPHPVLGRSKAIAVENDGLDRAEAVVPRPEEEISRLAPGQIRDIVFAAGIVGMGGASFPTHIKLNPPKPVDTLLVNGAECEPYLTGDYRLMLEKTKEILQGIELVAKCLGVKNVFIGIEDNKPGAIELFQEATRNTQYAIRVLKSQYPQGGEKQLIRNILKKEVPSGKLPFDVGVVVHNVATLYAIYEAVYRKKPLYERVVTVTGNCLAGPKNLLARIGTPVKDLIDFCGPLKEEPAKIIIGGPMMGIAQYTDSVPVIKSTTGVVLLDKKEALTQEEEFCIRCGACVRECPASLLPTLINLASRRGDWQEARSCGALDCIECGLCSYACPSNIMLVQSIRRAKQELMKK